jgi:hypothetical protein
MIIYPSSIKTNSDKLYAVYSLLEQMRLEHNRQGAIARADWKNLAGAWYTYALRPPEKGGNIFYTKQSPLLLEQCRLKAELLKSYGKVDWDKLRDQGQEIEFAELLWGDKATLKTQPATATSNLLDELKAIDLTKLSGEAVDPTEDFSAAAYVETDPKTHIVKTSADRITFTSLDRETGEHVVCDKGAAHFDDFTHLITVCCTACTPGAANNLVIVWSLSNDSTPDSTSNPGIFVHLTYTITTLRLYIYLDEQTGSLAQDYYYAGTGKEGVPYYLTIQKAGTALTCKIYSDAARTTLLDTLSLVITDNTFRYIAPLASYGGSGAYDISGYVELLDLQEVGGTTWDESLSDGIKGGDTLTSNATYNLTIIDGIKGGESLGNQTSLINLLVDGIKGGDTLASQLITTLSLSDGVKLGDNTVASLLYSLIITDGIKVGDTTLGKLLLNLTLSDGAKLGDTLAANSVYNLILTDGIKLADIIEMIATLRSRRYGEQPTDAFGTSISKSGRYGVKPTESWSNDVPKGGRYG